MLRETRRYSVVTAYTGEAGIQLAKKVRPDAIILDIKMPGMDGGKVAESLRDDIVTSSIPIIFLTGLVSQKEVDRQGGYIGGHPFIAKPFDVRDLADLTESITA